MFPSFGRVSFDVCNLVERQEFLALHGQSHRPGNFLPGPQIVAAAVEKAIRRPRRRIVVPLKYRIAIPLAAALPAVVDRVYAGKAAKPRGSRVGLNPDPES